MYSELLGGVFNKYAEKCHKSYSMPTCVMLTLKGIYLSQLHAYATNYYCKYFVIFYRKVKIDFKVWSIVYLRSVIKVIILPCIYWTPLVLWVFTFANCGVWLEFPNVGDKVPSSYYVNRIVASRCPVSMSVFTSHWRIHVHLRRATSSWTRLE